MATLFAVILPLLLTQDPSSRLVLLVEESTFGSFKNARRIAVTSLGWTYVVDAGTHTVSAFHGSTFSHMIGGYGWQSTSFDSPSALHSDGINVFVADYGNHRIQRFNRSLHYVSTLATRDTSLAEARFGYPIGVAVSRFGDLFVLDGENVRVVKFGVGGKYERTFGGVDQGTRQLRAPVDLAITGNDRVIVLEPDRLLEYDYFGNIIRVILDQRLQQGLAVTPDRGGLIVATEKDLLWFSPEGSITRSFSFQNLIASEKIVAIRDIELVNNRLYILTATRVHIFRIETDP
jgi:hypothetical protein